MCIYRDTGGLASNPGVEDGEKSTWYPLFVHALNYYKKPRGFMQMTSQNFRDETTMTTLSSRASFTSNTNGITMTYHNQYVDRVSSYTHFKDSLSGNLMHVQTVGTRCFFPVLHALVRGYWVTCMPALTHCTPKLIMWV